MRLVDSNVLDILGKGNSRGFSTLQYYQKKLGKYHYFAERSVIYHNKVKTCCNAKNRHS